MKIRILTATISAAILLLLSACKDSEIGAEITEYGLYRIEHPKSFQYKGLPSNSLITSAELTLIKKTTNIPAKVGNAFGFRYLVTGPVAGEEIWLTIVMKYPSPGLIDPSTGERHTIDRYQIPATVGNIGTTFYSLDSDWELARGIWTREIWHGNDFLISQSFNIQ